MAEPTGSTRDIAISTSLKEDVLLFESMTGEDHLSRPFEYQISMLSKDWKIDGKKLLGENVTVRLRTHDENAPRYFNGFVSSFSQPPGNSLDYARYQITIRPWLWFLTRTSDCRIFQNKTVPDIIKEVFRDHGFSDFEEKLNDTYREWENCVQYRETDFNFVCRLMEQEGIYYYFTHEDGLHKLIMADGRSAHAAYPKYETIPYYQPDAGAIRERDHIYHWVPTQQVQPGKIAFNSFDFKSPKKSLHANGSKVQEHKSADFEIYEYAGDYTEHADGQRYSDIRMEELASGFEIVEGAGDARGILSGALFTYEKFPRDDQNREYLVLGVRHNLQMDDYESGSGSAELHYECNFSVMDAEQTKPLKCSTIF